MYDASSYLPCVSYADLQDYQWTNLFVENEMFSFWWFHKYVLWKLDWGDSIYLSVNRLMGWSRVSYRNTQNISVIQRYIDRFEQLGIDMNS